MPRLGAKMRQVDRGHGIGGPDAQHLSRGHRGQSFAGPQDRQGAQKPLAIDAVIPFGHACVSSGLPHAGQGYRRDTRQTTMM